MCPCFSLKISTFLKIKGKADHTALPPHLRDHLADGRPMGLFHSTPCSCTLVLKSNTSESECSMDDHGEYGELLDEDENILSGFPRPERWSQKKLSTINRIIKMEAQLSGSITITPITHTHTHRCCSSSFNTNRKSKKLIPITQQGGMMQLPIRSSAGGRLTARHSGDENRDDGERGREGGRGGILGGDGGGKL